MNGINSTFTSIEQVTNKYLNNPEVKKSSTNNDISFEDILNGKIQSASELKFSKHASQRLTDRNIELSAEQNLRLEEGVQKAGAKGINESLVIVDSLAFIVNVPNNTVVTAIDQTESDNNIFTNIDGAVIA